MSKQKDGKDLFSFNFKKKPSEKISSKQTIFYKKHFYFENSASCNYYKKLSGRM